MWAIIPSAGIGQRIQPIACSKELLPVGHRADGPTRRPKAVSEFLLERLVLAGATRLCFVVSTAKLDIMRYYGERFGNTPIVYIVQDSPRGLCDAIFKALPLIDGHDDVLFGLPDTIWFPENALTALPEDASSLLLFPVTHPEFFDAVVTDPSDRVLEVQVKVPSPRTHWIWGAGRITARDFDALHTLWRVRDSVDEYLGTLFNAFIAEGGDIHAVRAGETYMDVGTYDGFRTAAGVLGTTQELRT